MTHTTLLFDLGGVIITLNRPEAVRRFKEIGMADADSRLDSYTQQGIFGQLEQGILSAEGFRDELSQLTGRHITHNDCLYAWMGYVGDVPRQGLDTLLKLRSIGHRLVLVSNTNPFIMSWALSSLFDGCGHGIDHYFHAIYTSYSLGAMKPSSSFFTQVIKAEQISEPHTAMFIDDSPANVQAASKHGLGTLLVANGADWSAQLMQALDSQPSLYK